MKIFVKTYGCQMNSRDSEHVIAQFKREGYELSDNMKDADVILFNTCSVRQHAEDRVWSQLGVLKQLKNVPHSFGGAKLNMRGDYPKQKIIGVIGCMAENLKNEIIEKMPWVDLVCGPNDLARVFELVAQIQKDKKNILAVGSPYRDQSFYKKLYQLDKKHSFVVIMEGCNNFCSYCIVPYVRGGERSRSFQDIFDELKKLGNQGISTVTLLGQNVNSYNGGCSFPELLKKLSEIRKIDEISFVTSHPKDASKELFEVMRDCNKVKKYLHLPIQSGSDKILRLMNRGYTRQHYLDLIKKYKAIVGKNAILGTDIIVGFPGEDQEDFEMTREIMEEVRFNAAYIFKYSPRLKTKASEFNDDVSIDEKKRRHKILLDLQVNISAEKK